MNITLYKNMSEYNDVDKDLTTLGAVTGTLREGSSMLDPVINFSGLSTYIANLNYAYIQEFGRYYYVSDVEYVRNDLWRVSMHVDVLYTYRTQIRNNYAIIERNENLYDLKLNDGLFRTQQNPRIAQYPFPSGFNTWNFVLAVAGN